MDLEIRIEALEAEVKVLKNEIQSILLEIQEQILQHYYPALRVEDSEPSDTLLRALDSIREKKKMAADASGVADAFDGDPVPRATPVSLQNLRRERPKATASPFAGPLAGRAGAAPGSAQTSSLAEASPPAPSGQDEDEWHAFSEVLSWVQENIGTMGEERVHDVIELYRQEGFISSRVAKALERSIALFA